MAQHDDYILDNDTGANFRADLNNYVASLRTTASGTTEPTNPVAGQFWVDTSGSPVLLKLRDSTNLLWITIYDITNDEGILSATATDSTSVEGSSAAVDAGISTIAKNTTTGGLAGDIIGDITGYANSIGTNTATQLLALSTRTAHKEMAFTDNLSAIYLITGAFKSTQLGTTGDDAILSYKIPFSGDVTLKGFSGYAGATGHNFYFAVNTNEQVSPTWAATSTATIVVREHKVTGLSVGDTLEFRATWGATTGSDHRTAILGIFTDEYGLYSSG